MLGSTFSEAMFSRSMAAEAQPAEADVGRGAIDPGRLGLAERVGEHGGERVEVVGLGLATDADLGRADLGEDLPELERALVHAAVGAEELPAHEHRAVREEDGDVVIGALAVLGDEVHRLVDLADHGLVVERVQRRELHQPEERHHDVLRQLPGVDLADHLALVLGEDVEATAAGLRALQSNLRGCGGPGGCGRPVMPIVVERAPAGPMLPAGLPGGPPSPPGCTKG